MEIEVDITEHVVNMWRNLIKNMDEDTRFVLCRAMELENPKWTIGGIITSEGQIWICDVCGIEYCTICNPNNIGLIENGKTICKKCFDLRKLEWKTKAEVVAIAGKPDGDREIITEEALKEPKPEPGYWKCSICKKSRAYADYKYTCSRCGTVKVCFDCWNNSKQICGVCEIMEEDEKKGKES